jgi:hypothetical protein
MNPRAMMELMIYFMAYGFQDDELQLHGATYVETMEGFSLMVCVSRGKLMFARGFIHFILQAAMGMGRTLDQKEQKEMMRYAFCARFWHKSLISWRLCRK